MSSRSEDFHAFRIQSLLPLQVSEGKCPDRSVTEMTNLVGAEAVQL